MVTDRPGWDSNPRHAPSGRGLAAPDFSTGHPLPAYPACPSLDSEANR